MMGIIFIRKKEEIFNFFFFLSPGMGVSRSATFGSAVYASAKLFQSATLCQIVIGERYAINCDIKRGMSVVCYAEQKERVARGF